jgi:hypothetical protein
MSGSPKYVSPSLTAAIRSTIEATRRADAVHEARRRRMSADAWLQSQQTSRRAEVLDLATVLEHELAAARERISPADEIAIMDEINRARATISAAAHPDLSNVEAMLIIARRRLLESLTSARAEAQQEQARQLDAFQKQLEKLRARLEALTAEADSTLEAGSLQKAQEALLQARRQALGNDSIQAEFQLRLADRAIDRLEHHVELDAADARKRREQAEQQLLAFEAMLAGLQADATVMRWLAGNVAEMQQRATELRVKFDNADYSVCNSLADKAAGLEADIVARANAAQIKADQRDYIAHGIRSTLAEMGFVVGELSEEHPGHPASAVSFSAVNELGRGINVSVPVEGEVFYDVDGYHKSTVSKVGGGNAAVCDSAQQVLEEMHDLLEDGFQVQMSELMWEGKDPERILRQADELPGNRPKDREDRK